MADTAERSGGPEWCCPERPDPLDVCSRRWSTGRIGAEDRLDPTIRRFFGELWNEGRTEVAEELIAPHHVHHLASRDFHGPSGVVALVSYLRTAFPDFHADIEDVLVEGDRTAVRWTATGTHMGSFSDLAPTGRRARWTGIDIIRVEAGRIVELWGNTDSLGLRQQLTD